MNSLKHGYGFTLSQLSFISNQNSPKGFSRQWGSQNEKQKERATDAQLVHFLNFYLPNISV